MAKIDFTITDLRSAMPKYEEGQEVTTEVLHHAENVYHFFHDRYLKLEEDLITHDEVSDALINYDESLEVFVNETKAMVRYGKTASQGLYSYYLDLLENYNELRAVINSRESISIVNIKALENYKLVLEKKVIAEANDSIFNEYRFETIEDVREKIYDNAHYNRWEYSRKDLARAWNQLEELTGIMIEVREELNTRQPDEEKLTVLQDELNDVVSGNVSFIING